MTKTDSEWDKNPECMNDYKKSKALSKDLSKDQCY